MLVRVLFLRRQGVPLQKREVADGRWLHGAIQLISTYNTSGGYRSLTLTDPDNQTAGGKIAVLFEPTIEGLGDGRMRFRGVERIAVAGGQAAVVQEWLVEIMPIDRTA